MIGCSGMPDMREKVKEYIGELEVEIQRCIELERVRKDGEYWRFFSYWGKDRSPHRSEE